MNIFFVLSFTLLGFIFGSFLNVVALRFNTGKSINGRSMCFSCSKTLHWYELVPVFSWLIQKGRCRKCSSRISLELLLSELGTGFIFGFISLRYVFAETFVNIFSPEYIIATLFLVLVFSVLIVIFFYDMRHKIIPDELSLAFGVISFISLFFFSFESGVFLYSGFELPSLLNLLAGVLVPLPFALIWLFSKGRLIGLGDPKLMVGIGFMLGLAQGFTAVFVSFWVSALFILCVFIINKIFKKRLLRESKKSIMKTEIPFGPFLILGTLITLVCNLNLFIY